MTMSGHLPANAAAAARTLRGSMAGSVLLAGDQDYENARLVWNGAVSRMPAVIARCTGEDDVVAVVRAAREHGLPLSVRGGGHDWAGRALCDGGVVADLTAMDDVTVTTAGTAVAGGGATAGDVVSAARPYGLVPVTGTVKGVGLAGLTLAGGYGPLTGRYGLALDNLLSARVVLADGRAVTASAEQHPDLFWALRGGGGTLGVVTQAVYRLRPLDSVLAGLLVFPLYEAAAVLRGYREVIAGAPDAADPHDRFLHGPGGPGRLPVADLERARGTGRETHRAATRAGDPGGVPDCADGLRGCARHLRLPGGERPALLAADPLAAVTYGGKQPGPDGGGRDLHVTVHRHRRASLPRCRYPGRRPGHRVRTAPGPSHGRGGHGLAGRRRRGTGAPVVGGRGVRKTDPHALPGGYPNLLGIDDRNRTALAYGPNLPRLREIRRRTDPDGVFSSAVGGTGDL